MSRVSPDLVFAEIDLLRAVDRLIVDADVVREKREILDSALATDEDHPSVANTKGQPVGAKSK